MLVTDTLTNIVSGLGTDKDKLRHSRFRPTWLTKFDLDSMYENDWISGKIVDAPCDDMTREWRTWNAGPRISASIEAEERRLGIRQAVNRAMKLARLYGGSGIVLGDGSENPEQELDLDRIRRGGLRYIHVLSRWELSVQEIDRDPLSPYFGEPAAYFLSSGTREAEIHPSRVVRFLGQAKLEMARSFDGWGLSTLQRVYDAVRNVASTADNTASLTHEAKVDVVSVPDLNRNAVDPNYQRQVIARFGLANAAKSIQNMLLLDANEVWAQKQVSFGGLVEVLNKFLEIASGAADIPVTRLLGTSPKGLNATGQSDIRSYYDTLAGRQVVELEPALSRLDRAVMQSALGRQPADARYTWNALWQMTEAEQAAIDLQRAQTAQIYGVLGAMPASALRTGIQNRLQADGTYPGLGAALDTAKAVDEASAPLMAKAEMTGNEINTPSAGAKVAKT